MADLVCGHWSVENNLHWRLDVSFCEDERRIRRDRGAENYSRLSRLALNLLKRDKSVKAGIPKPTRARVEGGGQRDQRDRSSVGQSGLCRRIR